MSLLLSRRCISQPLVPSRILVRYVSRSNIPLFGFRRSNSTRADWKESRKYFKGPHKQVSHVASINLRRSWQNYLLLVVLLSSTVSLLDRYDIITAYPRTKVFDSPRFTPFTIIKREEVSSTSIIITVRPVCKKVNVEDPYRESWERGTWSVEFKQPQLQIARSYTPLPPRDGDTDTDLRFLIRKEHKGEVSSYLHGLGEKDTVELRGPNPELDLAGNESNVVFLAGGTGIAPALQVVHTLLGRRAVSSDSPRIRIIWANRRREDCIGGFSTEAKTADADGATTGYIVKELQSLRRRFPEHLTVDYLVDEEGTLMDQKRLRQITDREPATSNVSGLLIVSGPEGFVNHFAGPKKWEGGPHGQGELGGIIGKLQLKGWKVWKL